MSDASTPSEPAAPAAPDHEVDVDLASFLPEGVSVAAAEPASTVDIEALAQIELDLQAVDAAIAALDAGTYGTCATCGEPIDDVLLAADPPRTTCAVHAA